MLQIYFIFIYISICLQLFMFQFIYCWENSVVNSNEYACALKNRSRYIQGGSQEKKLSLLGQMELFLNIIQKDRFFKETLGTPESIE